MQQEQTTHFDNTESEPHIDTAKSYIDNAQSEDTDNMCVCVRERERECEYHT